MTSDHSSLLTYYSTDLYAIRHTMQQSAFLATFQLPISLSCFLKRFFPSSYSDHGSQLSPLLIMLLDLVKVFSHQLLTCDRARVQQLANLCHSCIKYIKVLRKPRHVEIKNYIQIGQYLLLKSVQIRISIG